MMSHPILASTEKLERPALSARAMGYRLPAEFEPVEAVWLTPPHNVETWPDDDILAKAQAQHAAFAEAAARHARVQRLGMERDWPTDDSWIRDYGPIFVVDGAGKLACHDFVFNGWGGKYAGYPNDNVVPQRVAEVLNLPIWIHDLVLEGGSIDVNGQGTVMTTEQCLLNDNRNPGRTRADLEHELHEALGTRHAIWLPGGIVGDDTDGHVDDIARFVDPQTVIAVRAAPDHVDHAVLEANFDALQSAVDQDGKPLKIIALPAPQPIRYDFPPDDFQPGGPAPLPASYANFLFVNEVVLVPIFGQSTDDSALSIIERACGRTAIGLRAEALVVGLGALHCLSMQQPRAGA